MSQGAEAAPGHRDRLGSIVLVLILVAALASGVLVYRARTPDLALEIVALERVLTRGDENASFEFFVRFDEPNATIAIVGKNKKQARTLAAGVELEAGRRVGCVWDGRNDEGTLVNPGRYRLRVILPGQERDMVFPRRIDVVRVAPSGSDLEPEPAIDPCDTDGTT